MTATVTRQYRPIGTVDTSADDALSVREIRELADGMNNFKAHFAGPIYHRVGYWWVCSTGTAERVIDRARRPLAPGYTNILFQMCGKIGSASHTGTCTAKLYCSARRYDGPGTFDASYLGPHYSVSTGLTFTTDSCACPVAVSDLVPIIDADGYTHFTLTTTNSYESEFDFLKFISVVATPKVIL